ncbi:MAG: GatB/YqeY domain-containing protein [Candidatus Pacebacteria bacterium]|nr:GatB/YqeY domain-containing protein [Candidatus Paceibacterota bacterium]MDR3583081.1 GatB/YqeY domain-containing protein [Candidatus Paceibacterota bacterium]
MLKQKIAEDLKAAMKAGDAAKRDTLRMLDSMVKNVEIEKKKREEGLSDAEVQEVAARAVKLRNDAIVQYENGGRPELAEKEKREVEILSTYLPEQMDESETRAQVKEIISSLGATSKSEMGKVMGAAMGKLKGQADGNLVKKIVEEELK